MRTYGQIHSIGKQTTLEAMDGAAIKLVVHKQEHLLY